VLAGSGRITVANCGVLNWDLDLNCAEEAKFFYEEDSNQPVGAENFKKEERSGIKKMKSSGRMQKPQRGKKNSDAGNIFT